MGYYSPDQVEVIAAPSSSMSYVWGEKTLSFHQCNVCGFTPHWSPFNRVNQGRMGVNARLMPPKVLAAARVHRRDGAETWKYRDDA